MLPSESDSLELSKKYYEYIAQFQGVNGNIDLYEEEYSDDDTMNMVEILESYDFDNIEEEEEDTQ